MDYKFKPTHHGRMYGIPVLLDMTYEDCPGVVAKYKMGYLLDFMGFLFGCYCMTASFFNPEFEPMFPILVGKEIDHGNK